MLEISSKKAVSLDLPEETKRRYSNRELGSRLGNVSSRSGLMTNAMAFLKQWLIPRQSHNLKPGETDVGATWDIGTNEGQRPKITH